MLRDAPAAYIIPYNHTTTRRIGTNVTAACLGDLKPIVRVINTNNEPSRREDCISFCIAVEATYLVTGLSDGMTHVSGLSSTF